MAAAAGSLAEVAVGRLAADRAESADVTKFAQQMIDDHTKANQELIELASRKRIALPQRLEIKDQATSEVLGGLRRGEFDTEYCKQQFAAHMCAVQLFEAEAERGQDPEIKAWAARTLPKLREHLHMIRGMVKDEDLGGAGGAAGGGAERPRR
jgi:putative membrane protein